MTTRAGRCHPAITHVLIVNGQHGEPKLTVFE